MPDEPNPVPPNGDDGPEPDAAEAELIAYLDGELDPAAARKVEARLAADPKLRARADALKRSYDLLDFLPKPEPSPTFATRTLEKLPAVKSSPAGKPVAAPPLATTPAPQPHPDATGSSSGPVVPAGGTGSLSVSGPAARPGRASGWAWAFGLLVAVGAALGAGYLGTAAARTYLFPTPHPKDPSADNLPLADLRVIQNLPLYAAVDDLDFLDRLAAPEFFGEDVASPDGPTPPVAPEADKPAGRALDALLRAFLALPPDRQAKIRQLDQQLHDEDAAKRDRHLRVLEAYAGWLHRLPEADRKEVLAAPTPEKRLEAIREARRVQWVANLPAAYREKLSKVTAIERAELIVKWRDEEEQRREAWRVPRVVAEARRTGRPPWPLDDDRLRPELVEFVRTAYHPDDPKRCRLSPRDLASLQTALKLVQGDDRPEWAWLGVLVYDFTRPEPPRGVPRYELLPEPAEGDPPTTFEQLPEKVRDFVTSRKQFRARLDPLVGKWPDFALAVTEDLRKGPKAPPVPPDLGPCRPAEFRPEVRQAVVELRKKLTPAEAQALKRAEENWPAYPREVVRLARTHGVVVPGVMPPGPPGQWERTYNPAQPRRRGPAGDGTARAGRRVHSGRRSGRLENCVLPGSFGQGGQPGHAPTRRADGVNPAARPPRLSPAEVFA